MQLKPPFPWVKSHRQIFLTRTYLKKRPFDTQLMYVIIRTQSRFSFSAIKFKFHIFTPKFVYKAKTTQKR